MTNIAAVRVTVQEMLQDRGYTAPAPLREFLYSSRNEAEELYVYYAADPKVGLAECCGFLELLAADNVQHAIFVCEAGLTPFAQEKFRKIDPAELQLEIFTNDALLRNPTRHRLYNRHTLMDAEEELAFLARYRVEKAQLPKLFTSDAVCKYFNFPVGGVVRIDRCYGSAGPYVTYRVVTKNVLNQ